MAQPDQWSERAGPPESLNSVVGGLLMSITGYRRLAFALAFMCVCLVLAFGYGFCEYARVRAGDWESGIHE